MYIQCTEHFCIRLRMKIRYDYIVFHVKITLKCIKKRYLRITLTSNYIAINDHSLTHVNFLQKFVDVIYMFFAISFFKVMVKYQMN